jgi:hypothetical protein
LVSNYNKLQSLEVSSSTSFALELALALNLNSSGTNFLELSGTPELLNCLQLLYTP